MLRPPMQFKTESVMRTLKEELMFVEKGNGCGGKIQLDSLLRPD